MLRFHNYDIVFQEIPDEITLAINISNCPNRCRGCHSPHLQNDTGELLNEDVLKTLLAKYGNAITCVCFMGGDADVRAVDQLAAFIRQTTHKQIKCAWYSGKSNFPQENTIANFDYIKLGAYIEHLGGLDSAVTNQRFYRVENKTLIDMTCRFCKKNKESVVND